VRCLFAAALLVAALACGGGTPGEVEQPDAGDLPDSGAAADAGSHSDAGAHPDAGADDGGAAADAGSHPDAGASDAGAADAGADGGLACAVYGAPGQCLDVSTCAALGSHSSYPGYCPGPANIECCIKTPSVADNPPIPAGYRLLKQSVVTADMTSWAVSILHDTADYPMFSTADRTFGTLPVRARVEWHPPDFQNGAVHRGVTLYTPV
jgi:hypothetical protein